MRIPILHVWLAGLIGLAAASAAPAQSTITTVAGNGTYGYNGDNIPATTAELTVPASVTVDGFGNIFIADFYDPRIRRVTASTGIITTNAGDGTMGFAGDGGPATSAELGLPYGVAMDTAGNLYIADYDDNCIRMVSASAGIITTIAGNGNPGYSGDGGPATSAQLQYPAAVAVDASGNVYIADWANERIRKVTASTGIITTVAGTGNRGYNGDNIPATGAELFWPFGVALDTSGNLYIADTYNQRIRKVTASTGIITTVAGTGNRGYNGDNISATSAELQIPSGVALDASGNLYIADSNNQRIREVTSSTGIITTVAGTGTPGYNGDNIPATSAELSFPFGVAIDATGNLYIADQYNFRIREVQFNPPPINPAPTPVFMASGGGTYSTAQMVTVSDSAPGATLYCSTNTAPPRPIPADLCSNPIEVNGETALNAIAIAPNFTSPSAEASETYYFRVAEANFLNEVPSASGASTTVYLGDTTPGALIYYTTDGSIPVVSASDTSLYADPIVATKPETIKAIGVRTGYENSSMSTKNILLPAAQPVISPGTGVLHAPQTVTITDVTAGAPLYCVLNGAPAVPCAASYQVNSREEIQAYAEGGGYGRSVQATAFYTMKVASPTLSFKTGTYSGPLQVTLSDTTPGAAIFYTTNGSTPVPGNSDTYLYKNTPVVVSTTETVKVIAVLNGYENSSLAEAAYRIQ